MFCAQIRKPLEYIAEIVTCSMTKNTSEYKDLTHQPEIDFDVVVRPMSMSIPDHELIRITCSSGKGMGDIADKFLTNLSYVLKTEPNEQFVNQVFFQKVLRGVKIGCRHRMLNEYITRVHFFDPDNVVEM